MIYGGHKQAAVLRCSAVAFGLCCQLKRCKSVVSYLWAQRKWLSVSAAASSACNALQGYGAPSVLPTEVPAMCCRGVAMTSVGPWTIQAAPGLQAPQQLHSSISRLPLPGSPYWLGAAALRQLKSLHCALQVCGIISVGAVEGIAHVNWRLLRLYLAQWVLTIPAVGVMTAAAFSYGVPCLAGLCQLLLAWRSRPLLLLGAHHPAVEAMTTA